MGRGCPGFQQDEDPGTPWAAARAPGLAHEGSGGTQDGWGPRGGELPGEGGPPPPALACPGPSTRPSVLAPPPDPRTFPMTQSWPYSPGTVAAAGTSGAAPAASPSSCSRKLYLPKSSSRGHRSMSLRALASFCFSTSRRSSHSLSSSCP